MAEPRADDDVSTGPGSSSPAKPEWPGKVSHGERLQKVLAAAGLGSRRQCEQLILEGRVEVDRRVVTQLGTRVQPDEQTIRVDGVPVRRPRLVYYLVNKPRGVVATNRDPAGRLRVIDLIVTDQRLFPVGRLDKSSEGLLLVTNDGQLAYQLTHPRFGVPKTYVVQVAGVPGKRDLDALRRGVYLAEGLARVASVKVRRRQKRSAVLEIVLSEGRNREIRRLLARLSHKVMRLRRTAVGPLKLGSLPSGAYRHLTIKEVKALRAAVARGLASPPRKGPRRAGSPAAAGRASSRSTPFRAQRGKAAGARGRPESLRREASGRRRRSKKKGPR